MPAGLRVLAPAEALTGRLTFPGKIGALTALLLVPLLVAGTSYVDQQGGQVAFSAKERTGVAYLGPALGAMTAATLLRVEAAAAREDASGEDAAGEDGAGEATYGTTPCPPAEGVDEPRIDFETGFERCIDPAKRYTAVIETTEGTVTVALDTERTPITTNNFVALARYGYYDGTDLFRTEAGSGIGLGGLGVGLKGEVERKRTSVPESFEVASAMSG